MEANAKQYEYFIHLLQCALNETVPEAKPEELQWGTIYSMALRHSLSVLVYHAVEKMATSMDEELRSTWKQRNEKLYAKYVNQEYEEARLSQLFEAAQIPHMQLKGAWIRESFASPELREMSDIDILIPKEYAQKGHELVMSDHYEFKEEATTSHNTEYVKKPYLILELHTAMLPLENDNSDYYHDIWDKAEKTDQPYTYTLSLEQKFVYCIAHAYKHFAYCGVGVRSVVDVYALLQTYESKLDWDAVNREFDALQIREFAQSFMTLAKHWFSKQKVSLTKFEREMATSILTGATFGVMSRRRSSIIRKEMKNGKGVRGAKLTYLRKRLFPNKEHMKNVFPRLMKCPLMLPVAWVARWFKGLFTQREKISEEINEIKNAKISEE